MTDKPTNNLSELFQPRIPDDQDDMSELREMFHMANGWNPEFPAILDENGVVLVGNRRMKLAKEMGIEPVTKVIVFGAGEAADAERVKLALISNLGGKELSQAERKRIAQRLYGQDEWTMERIAEALNVCQATITKDLRNLLPDNKLKPAKTAANPKGAGRPKGSGTSDKPASRPRPKPVKEAILALNEQGASPEAIVAEVGCHPQTVRRALHVERDKKAAIEQNKAQEVALSQSAQKRLEHALARQTKQQNAIFDQRVSAEVERHLEETVLPRLRQREAEANKTLQRRRGFIDKATYMKILRTLHPDFNTDPDKKSQCDEAFNLFRNLKTVLLKEEDDPTPALAFPQNAAEMMEWGRKAREAKAQARAQAQAKRGHAGSVH